MNKTAIKNYAIWARVQLIEAAKQKAYEYAVTDGENVRELNAINGRPLSESEKRQRRELLEQIKLKGYQQVMEEAAYTWFNRFIALRFMEVNGYLPSMVRVFTDEIGAFKPEILKEAMTVELSGLDRAKVLDLIDKQNNDALYQYLLITQCNALNDCLPQMFERIDNWTELLFPKNLLRPDGVLGKMISMIPEEDWTDQVQIIGWLYQYYNTEPKDKVFENLKKNIKISKENIPAATQLFTPDWIVHYMVENSLGRLWVEGHPNEEMKKSWKYYLEEAEQEPEVQRQLAEIRKEYAKLNPEDIKVIDPCMGSGHILVVLFDVLLQIYESCGYSAREAVSLIVEKNLYGLDIDERAAQLAYFAVMMKARQYDRRFFTRKVQPHVYAIEESNGITSAPMHDMGLNLSQEEYGIAAKQAMRLVEEMHDAKEYGSIIHVTPCDWDLLRRFAVPREEEGQLHLDIHGEIEASARIQKLVNIGEVLAQKYHAVVTNPPYMGRGNMGPKLTNYLKDEYPDSKSDTFAVFIERCQRMSLRNYFQAMITQHAWMFLTSFEVLRTKMMATNTVNMLHLGSNAFDEIQGDFVQTTTFVLRNVSIKQYSSVYCRLVEPDTQDGKENLFLKGKDRYITCQDSFSLIPTTPVAYWASKHMIDAFSNEKVGNHAIVKSGMQTGNNDLFMRFWHEVCFERIGFNLSNHDECNEKGYKWVPQTKGGLYRKWYGNYEYIVNFENDCYDISRYEGTVRIRDINQYFKRGITWTHTTAGGFGARLLPDGFTFNVESPTLFSVDAPLLFVLGSINSKVAQSCLWLLNSAFHYHAEDILNLPIRFQMESDVESIVQNNIRISKEEWDSFETSWNFIEHPFVTSAHNASQRGETITIRHAFEDYQRIAEGRFQKLKENEEELNRIFIDIYGLQDELTPEVEDKDVTVRKADLQCEIRSLISYAVGCMFGRYSLDVPGLAYAGGAWDASKYKTFIPDADAILPICDDEYFEDDIVGRFVKFIEAAYGKDSLEENLKFIADALGGKGTPRQVIRSYFLNDFYADHLKAYQKRPIYWLFDSGKKNGFKCLIYMHRYQPDTIARIRTDYVHEQQERYRSQIQMIEDAMQTASTSERVKLNKQLTKFKDQALELQKYEEKIHHLADQAIPIDLDDGVKVNYAKFEDVLAKIK